MATKSAETKKKENDDRRQINFKRENILNLFRVYLRSLSLACPRMINDHLLYEMKICAGRRRRKYRMNPKGKNVSQSLEKLCRQTCNMQEIGCLLRQRQLARNKIKLFDIEILKLPQQKKIKSFANFDIHAHKWSQSNCNMTRSHETFRL